VRERPAKTRPKLDAKKCVFGASEDKGEARRQEERVRRQQRERKREQHALLKDFEIRPVVVHPTKRADVSRHGYRAAQFEDAFARFLPPEPNIRTL
jgi:hypothetical protein